MLEYFQWVYGLMRLTCVLMLVVAGWYSLNYEQLGRLTKAWHQKQYYLTELERLRTEVIDLHRERIDLVQGGFPAEKAVRERFYYAREGEVVVKVRYQSDSGEVFAAESPRLRPGL